MASTGGRAPPAGPGAERPPPVSEPSSPCRYRAAPEQKSSRSPSFPGDSRAQRAQTQQNREDQRCSCSGKYRSHPVPGAWRQTPRAASEAAMLLRGPCGPQQLVPRNESTSDRGCSHASSPQGDLSKLVIWAHTHGTICNQIPALELKQNMGLNNDNTVLWMCGVGHAYLWHCQKLHNRGEEETEAVGRRKRLLSSESLAMESIFEEKKSKLAPSSFEMGQADSGSTGSCGRSQQVTEQKADTRNNKSGESQNTRKPVTSFSAAEKYLPMFDIRGQTGKQNMKSKSHEDIYIISDEEQCEVDEDNQGDRMSQNKVSEPSAKELETLHCQKMALHQPAASQITTFSPTARPPPTHAYIFQTSATDLEDLDRNMLKQPPFAAAEPMAETSKARSLPGSEAPKVCLKHPPVSSTEARAQPESQPSVMFFELQVTADVQQHLQLSPPKCDTLGMDCSKDSAENMDKDSNTSGSRQTACSSASPSPESHPPAASNGDVLKKQEKMKRCTISDIKVFKEWLQLHHPSETRKIHTLPPADLDRYLVSFFSSAKRQNGMDFSASSLNLFQHNINHYLKNHNYQYNMLIGPEFRASQEAYKLKCWYLFQKKEGWSVAENLTDEDVEKLVKKGILSKTHPQGLLNLMFINLIRGFGASTHFQASQYWGQVVLRKTKGGQVEYLEWKDDLSPRENRGELSPWLFAKPEDPENCPVASYKEYARRRPPDMLNDNHPLYLSPKSLCSIWDEVWYRRKALTKAKMDKILKVIVQEVKGTTRKTRTSGCNFGFPTSATPGLL